MATIAVILNDCLREFTDLTASGVLAGFDDEVTERRWLDELGRLRVWAANIGAHQTGQSSLDYRLRDASHLKSETTKILQRTLQVLRNLQEVTKEDQHESSEETFSDDNEFEVEVEENELTDIQVLYQSLRNNINLLFQISMAIRKPADHDRLVGMNLKHASFFKPWAQQHISHKFPDAEASTILRLSAAMARQKAVLKYFERHSAKLGKGLLDHDDAESHLLSDTVATEMTLATEMDHLHFLETNSVAGLSQTSYASSIFTGNDSLSIPSAPKESADRTPFECPYCRLVIVVKNTKDWARHVFRDLMPYVCLSHDCITPSKLYESRRQWYRHMCEAHSLSDGHQNLSSCPLCQVNIEPPLSFEKHVGHHLEQLALFILPRTDTEDEQSLNDSPKTASVRGSRDPSVAGISETGVERESSGEIQRKWESPEEFLMRLGKLDEDEFQKTARQARFEVDIIGSAREAAYLPPSSDPGFQDSSASSAPEAERKLKVNEQFLMRSNNLSEDDSDKAVSQSSPQMMAHEQSYVLDPDDHETKRKSGNLSESATAFLRTWFHDHLDDPFPSEMDKQAFVTITGLSIGQINNWFINVRRRRLPIRRDQMRSDDFDSSRIPLSHAEGSAYREQIKETLAPQAVIRDQEDQPTKAPLVRPTQSTTVDRLRRKSPSLEQIIHPSPRLTRRSQYDRTLRDNYSHTKATCRSGSPVFTADIDQNAQSSSLVDDAFSYTTPREIFDLDYPIIHRSAGKVSGVESRRDRAEKDGIRNDPTADYLFSDTVFFSSEPQRPPKSKDDPMEPTSPPPHPTTVPENPRKGILRRPKPSFPEDLNFIQEGVAPIKDATKPGIPPGARWTKIDRRLVNPEALEAGRERFEERSDYVIVLRVLSKEEIQNYAVKTQEIRDGRQRQVQEKGKERHKLNKKQVQDTSDAGAQSDTVETKNSGSLLTLIT